LAYALWMMPTTLLWALVRRNLGWRLYLPAHLRAVADLYDQADLIVPVGGGYIRSREGLVNRFNIPLLLHPLLLGYMLGKPTILYSQSVGPFQNGFERRLVSFVLRRMNKVLLREDTSVALLASLGVTHNVARAVDAGFLLESQEHIDLRKRYKIAADKLLVGVTVRSWLKGAAQQQYEQAVASALDMLVETAHAHVIFIPQVTATKGDDDRVVSRRVYGLMRHAEAGTVVEDAPDHHQIKSMYDSLDLLLGTRFHSVIFSLTSYVPVLAIEYEHKTSGIMHDLKLGAWVIKIEDVTAPKLGKLLRKLVHKQEKYRAHLKRRLPAYLQQAEQTAELIKQAIRQQV
ncbi:MAG TPA: polysaccharide pyruvyl transferase family protein, partial [Candidatus Acidoferrum sp.]|nr:polysaccharide pyruvyl transferase family protein [Candidatus Acidoferrum sp.]